MLLCHCSLSLQRIIDILKLDVEYSEWDGLRAMMSEGSLHKVKQLVLEVHTRELGHTGGITLQSRHNLDGATQSQMQNTSTSVPDYVMYSQILQNLVVR